ncbi:MAG: phage tail tape measure protein, partial [Oscillospiraceae bacterium]|nr:phage tail tape measure protein [Oscillospiraceae bacterium]
MAEVVRKISTRIAVEGEREYRQAITNINAELNKYKSALALVQSEYEGSANSLEALSARQEALNQVVSAQTEKIAALKNGLTSAREAEARWAEQKGNTAERLSAARAAAAQYGESLNASKEQAKALETNIVELERQLSKEEAAHTKAANSVNRWQTDINRAETELNKLNSDLRQNDKYLKEASSSADNSATSIDRFGKSSRAGSEGVAALAAALAASGIQRSVREIADALAACVDSSVSFESALAGVAKTTGLSGADLAAMGESLKELSSQIPVTADELAAIAENAGQLGIANDNILDFTRVMADLGVSTNLSAGEASSALAKFANVTKMSADDYGRLGSVIVQLGNNFATTEADIVAMGTRLAATGELTGLSEAEIMALAAALSSLGIEAEAGGSAVSKLLRSFEVMTATGGEKLAGFAETAGMSASEFTRAWRDKPVAALGAFVDGLSKVRESGGSVAATLAELGLTEIRLSNAVSALASSEGILSSSLDMANSAWAENTALAVEAATRYETTESRMAMLRNSCDNLKIAVGDQLTPALNGLAGAGAGAAQWAADFVEKNTWLAPTLTAVVSALGLFVGGAAAEATVVNVLIPAVASLTAAMGPVGWAIIGVSAAVAGLTAGVAFFAAALPASEVEQQAARIRELGAAAEDGAEKFAEAKRVIAENDESVTGLIARLDELAGTTNRTAGENAVMAGIIDRLNEAVPNLDLSYNKLNGTLSITTEELLNIARAERARAEAAAAIDAVIDAEERKAELLRERQTALARLAEAEAAYGEKAAEVADRSFVEQNRLLGGTFGLLQLAQKNVRELNSQIAEQQTVIDENTAAVDAASGATEVFADAQRAAEDAARCAREEIDSLTEGFKDHQKAAESLAGASDLLSSALTEQRDAGRLSLDTINDLIEAGYASALQVDAETGAVWLNRDAYVALARAKIDERIAALESDRSAYVSALSREGTVAVDTARAVAAVAMSNVGLAQSMLAVAAAGSGEVKAYDAEIAALGVLRDSLGKTVAASASAVSGSAARASAAVSAAEAEEKAARALLEVYEAARAELDYLLKMDVISADEYYRRLIALRDEYLTGEGVVSEYRKVNEELRRAQDDALSGQLKGYEAYLESLRGDFESASAEMRESFDALLKQQEQMEAKLKGFVSSGVTERSDTGDTVLSDLRGKLAALDEYNRVLTELRGRNVPTSLMNEVLGLGVEGAIEYGNLLLAQPSEQWDTYMGLYERLQQYSEELSES